MAGAMLETHGASGETEVSVIGAWPGHCEVSDRSQLVHVREQWPAMVSVMPALLKPWEFSKS